MVCQTFTAATLLIAVLAIFGWALDVPVLKGAVSGSVAMNPITATLFVMAGGALLLLRREMASALSKGAGRALAGIVALAGLAKLGSYALGMNVGFDRMLFQRVLADNQVAPNTAGLFVLAGATLLLLDFTTSSGFCPAQCLSLFTLTSSFVAVVGYTFGGGLLYAIPSYIPMALNTALSFFLLSLGILASRPHRGVIAVVVSREAGGLMARRLLPTGIVVPFLMGWLCLQGSRAGVYDAEFGAALLVAFTIVVFMVVICWTARALDRSDRDTKDSESKLRAVLNAAADAIITIDTQGTIQEFNSAAKEIFGYEPAEVIGRSINRLMPQEQSSEHERYLAEYRPIGSREVRTKTRESVGVRKDGRQFPMELSVSEVQLASGRLFTEIVRDISAQKAAQAELNAAKSRAEESNVAKSQFLASMSHELRTPLHGVIGMVDLLCGTGLNERQLRFADACRVSARSLLALINDILDFSKIEAGRLVLDNHEFSLDQAVEDAVRLLGPRAREKRLELVCSIDTDACQTVCGDSTRLRQVLVNLIGNALKFTHQGEVVVRARLESMTTEILSVRFQVSDTGIGIPADRIQVLFRQFSQVDSSTTRRFGGTGLGLAISKSLVEAMGGRIGVESCENSGSTFWFVLQFQRISGSAPRMSVPSELRSLRVLVVACNPVLTSCLVETLGSWSITAEGSRTGREAMERLRDAAAQGLPFDLLIIDDQLPDVTTLELAGIARADRALSSPRVLLLRPLEGSSDDQPTVDHRLDKPVCRSELLNAITTTFCPSGCDLKESLKQRHVQDAASKLSRAGQVHILLAEDNRINRLYAEELLRQAGATCESVANGIQAVQAAKTGQFNLILMDCHMPDMDGFQATRAIRELEKAGSIPRHIPIVAVTANAVKGDRERCLDAGMDDYISKPFEQSELIALIDRVLATRESQPNNPPSQRRAEPPLAENEVPPIDADALLARCMGNTEFAKALLDEIESTGGNLVEEIARHAAARNPLAAAEAAHSLKGAAGIIAAERLRSLAAKIENAGKSRDLDGVVLLVDGVRDEMRRCLAVVPKLREQAL